MAKMSELAAEMEEKDYEAEMSSLMGYVNTNNLELFYEENKIPTCSFYDKKVGIFRVPQKNFPFYKDDMKAMKDTIDVGDYVVVSNTLGAMIAATVKTELFNNHYRDSVTVGRVIAKTNFFFVIETFLGIRYSYLYVDVLSAQKFIKFVDEDEYYRLSQRLITSGWSIAC